MILPKQPNLNSVNYTSKKFIRLPGDLTHALSEEERAEYASLSLKEKDTFLREQLSVYLKGKGIDLKRDFQCPDRSHFDRHPHTKFDPAYNNKIVKCWTCDETYSIYDICWFDFFYEEGEGKPKSMPDSELPAVRRKLEDLFGLRVAKHTPTASANAAENPPVKQTINDYDEESERRFNRIASIEPLDIRNIQREVSLPSYSSRSTTVAKWATRGINERIVDQFNLGYSPDYDGLVIPTPNSYFIRFLNPANPKHKADRPKDIELLPFNLECLLDGDDKPIYITEGEIDALSFIQSGAKAIALGGLGDSRLIAAIKGLSREQKAQLRLVVATDNDDGGRNGCERILNDIKELGVRVTYIDNLYGACKDANEFLMKDAEGFNAIVERASQQAIEELSAPAPFLVNEKTPEELAEEYKQNHSMLSFMDALNASLTDPSIHRTISTGIEALDEPLGGGFRNELYVIGACSSLGKTTLCHQTADYLSQNNMDVLFYSLEMSREALAYKSITRLSALSRHPVLTDSVLCLGDLYNWSKTEHSPEEKDRLARIVNSYKERIAPNLYIQEAAGTLTVEDIRAQVQKHIDTTGNTPVLFVDYLQIIGSSDERWDTKKTVDYNVSELKRISRDFETPVILISSLNRANYTEKISMQAFKESGSIEYGCDVLIGLQLAGVAEVNTTTAGGKALLKALDEAVISNKQVGKELLIDLRILKNRNGAQTKTKLTFNSRAGYFKSDYDIQAWVKDVWAQTPSGMSYSSGGGRDWLDLMLGLNLSDAFLHELDALRSVVPTSESGYPKSQFGYIQNGIMYSAPDDDDDDFDEE